MRLPAVSQPKQPQRDAAAAAPAEAAQLLRRLVSGGQSKPQPLPLPAADNLPSDLDERVRLVGEW